MSPRKENRAMFNEDLKDGFIHAVYSREESTRKQVEKLLLTLGEYERKYGADFSQMNEEQTKETAKAMCGYRTSNANTIFFILREYVKWCRAQGYDTSDAIWRIRLPLVEKMRSSFVGSPAHLKMSLDMAFPDMKENDIKLVYRSFLWLGFMGFRDSEAICVTVNDVHFDNMKVTFGDWIYPIYAESLPDLHGACELTSFDEPRGNIGTIKERASGDAILRGKTPRKPRGKDTKGEKTMQDFLITTLRPMVSRAFSAAAETYEKNGGNPPGLSLDLSYNHVYLSGIFYRMYEEERIGRKPDFTEIVSREHRNSSHAEYDSNYTRNKFINGCIRNYEADYMNWKSLFT